MNVHHRGFAKKTLMKTAKVAGLKSGKGNKRNKYHFPSNNKSMTSPGRMSLAQMANMDLSNENLAIDDDLSGKSRLDVILFLLTHIFVLYLSSLFPLHS